ncbi:UNVERIFIED_CONTAM: hypothetical protein HDU68_005682, partial [Siphonaria sp. JEL0065]
MCNATAAFSPSNLGAQTQNTEACALAVLEQLPKDKDKQLAKARGQFKDDLLAVVRQASENEVHILTHQPATVCQSPVSASAMRPFVLRW